MADTTKVSAAFAAIKKIDEEQYISDTEQIDSDRRIFGLHRPASRLGSWKGKGRMFHHDGRPRRHMVYFRCASAQERHKVDRFGHGGDKLEAARALTARIGGSASLVFTVKYKEP